MTAMAYRLPHVVCRVFFLHRSVICCLIAYLLTRLAVMHPFCRLWATGQETFAGGMLLLDSRPHLTPIGKASVESSSHQLFLEIVVVGVLPFCFMIIHFRYLIW